MNDSEQIDIGYPDELTRYMFNNYGRLLTAAEQDAWTSLMQHDKATMASSVSHESDPAGRVKAHLELSAEYRTKAVSADAVVSALLDRGPKDFYISVSLRLLRDHPTVIQINLCPKCLALCRTPKAKQCPRCSHNWHEDERRGTLLTD